MKKAKSDIIRVTSISQHHQFVGLHKPEHPLISIVRFEDFPALATDIKTKFTLDFYTVTIKQDCVCKTTYGQTNYDFDEGVMSFIAPDQVLGIDGNYEPPTKGWLLMFHPDFIRRYSLSQKIKEYHFFHYALHEALILSEKEEASIEGIFKSIEQEYHLPIDDFSQDLMVAQIELLLTFCNRYYNRQFITRKSPANDLLTRMEVLLTNYFNSDKMATEGLPTVAYVAEQLNMSSKYMSDLLRKITGQSAQQHIQNQLVEKAKQILSTTHLSVSEIAYLLGFGYPQSFNKLFKKKTNLSPLEFRQSFN